MSKVSLTIIEIEIPMLEVEFPSNMLMKPINWNDDIKIEMKYGKDIETASFDVIILFDNETIGTKRF